MFGRKKNERYNNSTTHAGNFDAEYNNIQL
jgi:hypothetical protein